MRSRDLDLSIKEIEEKYGLGEESSKEFLLNNCPNYLKFVKLTKSNKFLTYYDMDRMFFGFIEEYKLKEQFGIDIYDESTNGLELLSTLLIPILDHVFELFGDIYKLKGITNRKQKLRIRNGINKELKELGMKFDCNFKVERILNELFITEESQYINNTIKYLGYEIPTNEELTECLKDDNLSDIEREDLIKQINR